MSVGPGNLRRLAVWACLSATLAATAGSSIPVAAAAAPAAQSRTVEDLAGRLGIKPATLEAAIRATVLQRWNEAATAHHLPEETTRAGQNRIASAAVNVVADMGHIMPQGPLVVAAKALGLTVAALVGDLRQGKNLTQIAEAHGKDPAAVRKALLTEAATAISWQAAERGWNAAQQEQALSKLTLHIERWMTARMPTDRAIGPPQRAHALAS